MEKNDLKRLNQNQNNNLENNSSPSPSPFPSSTKNEEKKKDQKNDKEKEKENLKNYSNSKKEIDEKDKEKEDCLSDLQFSNILIKLTVVIIGFGIWIIYRLTIQHDDRKWDYIYSFEDKIISQYLLGATNYISQNLYIRDYLLISSSIFLDIFMVCFSIVYVCKGNSWNPLVHMGLFYGLRGVVIQNIIIMQIYDTYIFEYPGFPSLIVPFFRAADFFYSGHSGCAVLLGLQLSDMGYSEMKYFGFILGIFEGMVLIVLRVHYSIDVIFGIIFSHYIYYISRYISKYLDMLYPMGEYNQELIDKNGKQIRCCGDDNDDNVDSNANANSNFNNQIDEKQNKHK
jgi:hypothetical protein